MLGQLQFEVHRMYGAEGNKVRAWMNWVSGIRVTCGGGRSYGSQLRAKGLGDRWGWGSLQLGPCMLNVDRGPVYVNAGLAF